MSQVESIFPYVCQDTDYFLLAGPASGDEGQAFKARFPHVAVIGFEPNPTYVAYQESAGFPGPVLPLGLWSEPATLVLRVPIADGRPVNQMGSFTRFNHSDELFQEVHCRVDNLDYLSLLHGPFQRAMLWLDVELAEAPALRGAANLLRAGAIRTINVELLDGNVERVQDVLREFGYILRLEWNVRPGVRDAIYEKGT